jgi:hypothetical protein
VFDLYQKNRTYFGSDARAVLATTSMSFAIIRSSTYNPS